MWLTKDSNAKIGKKCCTKSFDFFDNNEQIGLITSAML